MRDARVRLGVLACVIALAVGVSGCGAIAEKAGEKIAGDAIGGKVDVEDDKVTVTGDDGSTIISGEQELPDGFPSDVPVYEDARITASLTGGSDSEPTYTITFLSNGETAKVYDWYMAQIKAKGWKIGMTIPPDQGGFISAEKGSLLLNAGISATTEDGAKTSVVLTVVPSVNP